MLERSYVETRMRANKAGKGGRGELSQPGAMFMHHCFVSAIILRTVQSQQRVVLVHVRRARLSPSKFQRAPPLILIWRVWSYGQLSSFSPKGQWRGCHPAAGSLSAGIIIPINISIPIIADSAHAYN
eukprot:1173788-Rhodomonas_salina.2